MKTPVEIKTEIIIDEAAHWRFITDWRVPEQSDDRMPLNARSSIPRTAPATQKSVLRRIHQINFKRWSQDRHD